MSPAPEFAVRDDYGRALEPGFLDRVVAAARGCTGRADLAVSLLLTDEAGIAAVHEDFLGDPTGTDVISFPMDDGVDLVVSVERAENESARLGHAFEAELALYIVHGILHVCGFDDTTESERARMREAERDVLRRLGLRVSPVDG